MGNITRREDVMNILTSLIEVINDAVDVESFEFNLVNETEDVPAQPTGWTRVSFSTRFLRRGGTS